MIRNWLHSGLILLVAGCLWMPFHVHAQMFGDVAADVSVEQPRFSEGTGPRLAIDAAHWNLHSSEGSFRPFADLLRNDGYRVADLTGTMDSAALRNVDVLVIANALHADNVDRWSVPIHQAFAAEEVTAIVNWVRAGGALLLIADHFPFPGAVSELAAAFGFDFLNGFVFSAPAVRSVDVFTRDDDTLREHWITSPVPEQAISVVATFTGSAIRLPEQAVPLLVFPDEYVVLFPDVAWEFSDDTRWIPAGGYAQGAVMTSGRGRVAIFGEAGMFTAQVSADDPRRRVGFNVDNANDNRQFILNLMIWLSAAD